MDWKVTEFESQFEFNILKVENLPSFYAHNPLVFVTIIFIL